MLCFIVTAVAAVVQVTIIEAVLTLVQFGLLLVIAWAVDVKVWARGRHGAKGAEPDALVVSHSLAACTVMQALCRRVE